MKSIFTRAGTSSAVVLSAAALIVAAVAATQAQGQWKQLFDGKDFTGWTVPAGGGGRAGATPPATPPSTDPAQRSWKVDNGVISSVPITESKQSAGGINTVDKFLDFELELDYKLDEAPNTDCTPKLGPKPGRGGAVDPQANLSKDGACTFNSGISFRSGYQLNLGRREAGEYVGVVVHRQLPEAIRGNVDWISTGDCGAKNHTYLQDCSTFPEIRKKGDWNHVRITFKADHLQVWLNNKQITDVMDKPMVDKFPAEKAWGEAQPINLQFPPAGEGGGFPGKVQYKNIRIRTL
jgi:hypothetical protein